MDHKYHQWHTLDWGNPASVLLLFDINVYVFNKIQSTGILKGFDWDNQSEETAAFYILHSQKLM